MSKVAALAVFAAIAGAGSAHANVTISSSPTANMSCSAGVCAPTGTDANLNVSDLENFLASGNLEITTTGNSVQATNINVAAGFSWASNYSLTLAAYHSISVEALIADAGAGGLAFVTNQGGKSGTLRFGAAGSATLAGSASLTIDGVPYVLVGDLKTLASDIANEPGGNYALANSYDASADGTYSSAPIPTALTGTVQGLGNTISNLSITSRASAVGLFADTQSSAAILNLKLDQANITDNAANAAVGGLVGSNAGLLQNDSVNGEIDASDAKSANSSEVGALTGVNSGTVANCESSGQVDAAHYTETGGLVGLNTGVIRDSHTKARVNGGTFVGGLTAFNFVDQNNNPATVINSYATGRVTAKLWDESIGDSAFVGGLIGMNYGFVKDSHASGAVIGVAAKQAAAFAGGLVGYNTGCCGERGGVIKTSYATGAISAKGYYVLAGGLVGVSIGGDDDHGQIANDYATGAIKGTSGSPGQVNIGGLIGYDITGDGVQGTPITTSYSTGAVSGVSGANIGGFIGAYGAEITDSYWDTTTSGTSQGTGTDGNVADLTGLTTQQLQSGLPQGFDPTIWTENAEINNGLPYLINNPPAKK